MTEKKAKKEERYGCLTKSLEDFLYLSEEQRFKKYKYDVNKYYQRVVKNVNASITDIMIAYTHLPKEQQKKIHLISHVDTLVGYLAKQRLEGTPKKIITSTKKQLIAIIESHIRPKPLQKLAEPDFNKIIDWLQYITPKNPKEGSIQY